MEEPQPRRFSGRRKEEKRTPPFYHNVTPYFLRSDDSDDLMMVDAVEHNSPVGTRSIVLYYTLLFLKVVLWMIFAWILSHLHMGAPCFLLPLTIWLYSGPMDKALKWAKRRLRGPVA